MTELIATGIVATMTLLSGSTATGNMPMVCTMQYAPVCAEKQVQCIKAPCDPVRQTYGNACMAAADQATILFKGECTTTESGAIIGGDKDEHGCLIAAGYSWNANKQQCTRPWEDTTGSITITGIMVGNDRDAHGCIGSAGYSWNENLKECVRPRELTGVQLTGMVNGGCMESKDESGNVLLRDNGTPWIICAAGINEGSEDIKQQNIISWAHDLGITKYNTVADFNWNTLVTREQAAKMIISTIDIAGVKEWMIKQSAGSCEWTDADSIDSSLLPMVTKSCMKGLFHGSNGEFMPKTYLTDTDSMTVMMRAAQYIPALADIMMRSKFAVTGKPLTRGELLTKLQGLYQQIVPVVAVDPMPEMTLRGEYYLASYNATGLNQTGITIMFDETGVHAKFCNVINASYVANGDMMNFGPMISTKMYCDDAQLMSLETSFGSLFSISHTVSSTGLVMTTTSGDVWTWKKK